MKIPPVLIPYQGQWVTDLSQVKVYEKSRRIGISWSEASDDALLAAAAGGMDVWYIGYNKDMAQEFINDCAFWTRHYNLAAGEIEETVIDDEDKDILAFRIKYTSGHRITALSSRPSNLRGKQGKVVIDEAAFHDDLESLMKAAIALLMWGGRVAVISTHNGDDNYFNEIVNEIRAGKKPYSLHRTTLDDALKQGLYKRICLKLERDWSAEAEEAWRQKLVNFYGDAADEELFCIPSRGSGIYLSRALIEACMHASIPVLRWHCEPDFKFLPKDLRKHKALVWCREHLEPLLKSMPRHHPSYFGEDFGRSGDLTDIWPIQELDNLKTTTPFLVELRNVPFQQQKQVLFYLVDRLPRFTAGALDARGNGQYLAEVAAQNYGESRIAEVMPTSKWYLENMPRYKAAFEDNEIMLPSHGDILDDHRSIKMEKGIPKIPDTARTKGRDGLQRHGDSAVAGCMAWYALKVMGANQFAPPEVVPVGELKREAERMLVGF